jgi:hypothetical protein
VTIHDAEPVLAFVIPLMSREVARDWDRVEVMAVEAVRSTVHQNGSPRHRITVLVANDDLASLEQHDGLDVVHVRPTRRPQTHAEKNADKVDKLRVGLARAAKLGATHAMVVDADDLVDRRIASYVGSQPVGSPGWQLTHGYVWRDGSRVAFRKRFEFHRVCGSSVIARLDLQHHLFVGGYYQHWVEAPGGERLAPLPFPGAVYRIMHGDNTLLDRQFVTKHRAERGRVGYLVRQASRYRPVLVTGRLRRQFGRGYEHSSDAVPAGPARQPALRLGGG